MNLVTRLAANQHQQQAEEDSEPELDLEQDSEPEPESAIIDRSPASVGHSRRALPLTRRPILKTLVTETQKLPK